MSPLPRDQSDLVRARQEAGLVIAVPDPEAFALSPRRA